MPNWFSYVDSWLSNLRFTLCVHAVYLVLSLGVASQGLAASADRPNTKDTAALPRPMAAQVSFNHLSSDELVALDNINAITQDKNGFMWFGGQNGLARYDGYRLDVYRHKDNDPKSVVGGVINDLLVDSTGTLWVATGSGLSRYDYNSGGFVSSFNIKDTNSPAGMVDVQAGLQFPTCMLEDKKKGGLWIGTYRKGLVYFNPATGTFNHYSVNSLTNSLHDDTIYSIAQDDKGHIWLGLNEVSLAEFDPDTTQVTYYSLSATAPQNLAHNQVISIIVDSSSSMWIGTFGAGIYYFNPQTGKAKSGDEIPAENVGVVGNYIRKLYRNREQEIWVGSDQTGLYRYDRAARRFIQYVNNTDIPNSLASNIVLSLFEDRAGDMWFGLKPSGIDMIYRHTPSFSNYSHNAYNTQSLISNDVLSIIETSDGSLWVGTEDGVSRYDGKQDRVEQFRHNPANKNDPAALPAPSVLAMMEDSRGNVWASTWGGGLSRYDPAKKTFSHFFIGAPGTNTIADNRIWSLYEDSAHIIWLGYERVGLGRYDPNTQLFTLYSSDSNDKTTLGSPLVRSLYEDSQKNFWVGTGDGLDLLDRNNGKITHYVHDNNNPNSLGAGAVTFVLEDASHRLWVGTFGGGLHLLDRTTGNFTPFRMEQGLPDNAVNGMLEDSMGFLWISTNNGLSRLDPTTMKFKNYNKSHGLPSNLIRKNTGIKRANGELVFGGKNGFTLFNPKDVAENTYRPPVMLTNFSLLNQPVVVGEYKSPLQTMLTETKSITLKHEQSVLTFDFAALNYRFSRDNQYAYQLEGFDKQWNYVGAKRSATYTNLDPGEYVLRVKASNDDGLWNETGTSLNITIMPPLWRTWWAYSAYLMAVLFSIYWFIQSQRKKVRDIREKIVMERMVNERLRNLDRLKENFLANTSHELRTPLNGIIGLAESISTSSSDLPNDVKEKAKIILFSGKRLANIVNDILEFSQLANNELVLHLGPVQLRPVVERVLAELQDRISDKLLTVNNNVGDDIYVFSHEHKLSQIMHRIVDNAIKFTREGAITINHRRDDVYDCISVIDTGIGISSENMNHIFTAFQQAEGSANRIADGAGLGLSVIKKLVELHQGDIQVESELEKGSTFCVRLPKLAGITEKTSLAATSTRDLATEPAPAVNPPAEVAPQHQIHKVHFYSHLYEDETAVLVQPTADIPCKILVVDDDPVNRMVVKAHLRKQNCNTLEAIDGADALKVLAENPDVDLIILDVMMPYMTGYDVCETLRNHYGLHQLPIIFLTANHQPEEVKKAFSAGGSDFLTKPISGKLLVDKVKLHFSLLQESRLQESSALTAANSVVPEAATPSDTPSPNYLTLQDAASRMVEQAALVIAGAQVVGCWLVNGEMLERVSQANTASGLSPTAPIPRAKVQCTMTENEAQGTVALLDGAPLAKSGSLGSEFQKKKYLLCEPIMVEQALVGFLIAAGDTEELLAFENKNLFSQFRKHLAAASVKHRHLPASAKHS